MLKLEEILKHYPNSLAGKEEMILKEYLQHKILHYIFTHKYWNNLFFIWWTCLRVVYGSLRFSEDIDLDATRITFQQFMEMLNFVKTMLEKENFKVETVLKEKDVFHCNIKFPGLLYQYNLSPHKEEKIWIKVDIADQNINYTPQKINLNKFNIQTTVQTAPLDILYAQKIYTAFNRKRLKGRDFYDIVFLSKKVNKPNYLFLKQKIWINNPSDLKQWIFDKIKERKVDFEELQKDVQDFLFDPNDKTVLNFPKIVKSISF